MDEFPPTNMIPTFLMWAGLGIFGWLWIRGRLRNTRQKEELKIGALRLNGDAKLKPNQFDGTKSLGAPPEVLKWQVELHELGRQLKGELDAKMLAVRHINRRLDESTDRIGELIRIAQQFEGESLSNARQAGSDFSKIQQLASAGWSRKRIAETMGFAEDEIALLLTSTLENGAAVVEDPSVLATADGSEDSEGGDPKSE